MSGFEEEQAMEAEALEAIFADDVTIVSAATPRQYEVHCVPHPNGEDDNHGKASSLEVLRVSMMVQKHGLVLSRTVAVRITFTLPAAYPDVVPELAFASEKGLNAKQLETLRQHAEAKVR
jgi:hypothetical protein